MRKSACLLFVSISANGLKFAPSDGRGRALVVAVGKVSDQRIVTRIGDGFRQAVIEGLQPNLFDLAKLLADRRAEQFRIARAHALVVWRKLTGDPFEPGAYRALQRGCLLYTSDAADDLQPV